MGHASVLKPSARYAVHLSDWDRGVANNLNLIRMGLASSVVFTHAYGQMHRQNLEPLTRWAGGSASLGDMAVFAFFFLSGFLIFRSAIERPDPVRFLRARMMRIGPGLVACVFLLSFVMGPLCTTLPLRDYFRSSDLWEFVSKIILHAGPGMRLDLPGVFANMPDDSANTPLWTLSSEWTMYMVALTVALLWAARSHRTRPARTTVIVCLVAVAVTAQMMPLPKYFSKWGCFFVLGGLAYLFRDRIRLSIPIAAAAVVFVSIGLRYYHLAAVALLPFTLAYALLVMAFHPALYFRPYRKVGDFSFGMYIYAWPVAQLLAPLVSTPLHLTALSWICTLPLAAASWYLIEAPAQRIAHPGQRVKTTAGSA